MKKNRCGWCRAEPLYQKYHDTEWGVPSCDEHLLFEMFILETLQAGLSWWVVLTKREDYREALFNFDARKIAAFTEFDYERLMAHPNLIKNRLKMRAIIHNAKIYLRFCEQYGGFSEWLWSQVDHNPIQNNFATLADVPVTTELSNYISIFLKKEGFKFFGSTTCYAYMQAIGLVNDHVKDCFRFGE